MTSPPQNHRRLNLGVHGDAGSGKSVLAVSGPKPVLVLDAEAGAEYLPGKITHWDPTADKPPEKDLDNWDTCIVSVREWSVIDMAYQWLTSGDHPFESLSLDSVTEIQDKCGRAITGGASLEGSQWQELLRSMNDKLRAFRDLKTHPTHPLWSVTYVFATELRKDRQTPMAQGKLRDVIPFFTDVFGYLELTTDEMLNEQRVLRMKPSPRYIAKERVGGRLGSEVLNPNITEMIRTLNATN